MQACNFVYPQSQEKCKYSRERNYSDILTPMQSLAPSNYTCCLSVMAGAICPGYGPEEKTAIPRMERLSSGITRLASYSKEEAIYSASVGEAAFSFSLPLVCPRKQRKDAEKGWSTEPSLMFHDPSWSQTQSDIWDWAYLIRPKDLKTFPHSEA